MFFMSDQALGKFLILCGCIHDIAEKTKDTIAQKQLFEVLKKFEAIAETQLYIKENK